MAGDFTFGIEEEYFLVDARTKRAVRSMPETFFKAAKAATDVVDRVRNADIDAVGRAIVVENKWRAQRYGVHGTFIAAPLIAEEGALPVAECLKRVIAESARDAEALGCTDDVERCAVVAAEGTSADAQLAIFEAHKRPPREEALRAVLDWIAAATLQ